MGLRGLGTTCPPDKENFFESRNDFQETEKIPMLGKLMSWYRLGGKINWPRLVQAVEEQNGAPWILPAERAYLPQGELNPPPHPAPLPQGGERIMRKTLSSGNKFIY